MGKYNPNKLLALAGLFETKAKCLVSDRFWALTVIAGAATDKIPGAPFTHQVRSLTGADPTDEEWVYWLDVNKNVVGNLPWEPWSFNDQDSSYCSTPSGLSCYLTKSKSLPNSHFSPHHSVMLSPSGPIPPLWVHIGEDTQYNRKPLSLELGHDAWLVEGLSQVMGASQSRTQEFLMENKKQINKIRRSFETSNPKYLGGGADGAAFDIGGGKVLKVFRDITSYQKALLAFDRLHKSPSLAKTEAMIYDIGVLGQYARYPDEPPQDVYYYIMEKMKPVIDHFGNWNDIPLRTILIEVASYIGKTADSNLRALKKDIADPTKAEVIKKNVKEKSHELAAQLLQKSEIKHAVNKMNETITTLKPNWLELYIEEVIMKYLTGRTDLHMGNIGVTNYGELRYYDPAYGGHNSEINV